MKKKTKKKSTSKIIRICDKVKSFLSAATIKTIKKNAIAIGLHKLDFSKYYTLTKIGSMEESGHNNFNSTIHSHAQVFVIGNDEYIWFCFQGSDRAFDWSRTSPIVTFKKLRNKYVFTTQNSVYELRH